MKEYVRPEIEIIKFNTESIANHVNGSDSAEDNILSGDLT